MRALCLLLLLAACDDRHYALGTLPPTGGGSGQGQPPPPIDGTGGTTTVSEPMIPGCAVPNVPTPDRQVNLPAQVLAERLARFLWSNDPDADLVARAAAAGTTLRVQLLASAMTTDPRFAGGVDALAREWLGTEAAISAPGGEEVKGEVDAYLRKSMTTETFTFVRDLFAAGDGRLSTLLLSPQAFIDDRLAQVYGVPAPATSFGRVTLDQAQRSGILTQASFLFSKPRISGRGNWVRTRLLCQEIPPPPPPQDTVPIVHGPGQTERQALEGSITTNPGCQACHTLIDPIGFAFDHYDALGRWHEADNGKPIDATGSITLESGPIHYDGARQLGERLLGSCELYRCVVQAYLQRALGSPGAGSASDRAELLWAFVDSGLDLRALFTRVAASPSFLAP